MNELTRTDDLQDLADSINAEHDRAEAALQSGLEHAHKAGQMLKKAKALCAHGEWLSWVNENCRFSTRTAQAYMRIADRWSELEANAQRDALSPLREALRELAEPIDRREQENTAEDCSWLPDFNPTFKYSCIDLDSSVLVEFTPKSKHPDYWTIGIFRNVFSDKADVIYTRRGCKLDRKFLASFLRSQGLGAKGHWKNEPAPDVDPWYVTADGPPLAANVSLPV